MSLLHSAGFNNDLSNNADLSVTRMRIQDRAGTVSMVLQSDATTLDMQSVGPITIDSSTGAISIGSDAVAQPVRIGTGAAARVITIGNAASASMALDAGVGAFTLLADTTCDLDSGTAMSLNSSAGAINIGNDAIAQAINIGTGAAARTITIGNVTTTTAVVLNSGTGGIDVPLATPIAHSAGFLVPCYSTGVHQAITGPGAAVLTASYTRWTTTGADAGTLAAPGTAVPPGFIKTITLISDGGDLTLTVTGLAAANDVWVFSELGQALSLMAINATTWVVIDTQGGDTTVDTMPTFA